jgi:hypothetical protein
LGYLGRPQKCVEVSVLGPIWRPKCVDVNPLGSRRLSTLVRMEAICVDVSPNGMCRRWSTWTTLSTLVPHLYVIPHGRVNVGTAPHLNHILTKTDLFDEVFGIYMLCTALGYPKTVILSKCENFWLN